MSSKFFIILLLVILISPVLAHHDNDNCHNERVCEWVFTNHHWHYQCHDERICPPIPPALTPITSVSYHNPFQNTYESCINTMNEPANMSLIEGHSFKAVVIAPIGFLDGLISCNYNEIDTLYDPITHQRLYFNDEIEENRVSSVGITSLEINTPSRKFTVQASMTYTTTPTNAYYYLYDNNNLIDYQVFQSSIIRVYDMVEV